MPLSRYRRGRTDPPPPYFLVTAFTTMMLVTGMNILVPVLPGYARSFGVSATEIGMVVAAFAVGRLLFDVIGGALADRFGVRVVCEVGCVVTGLASIVGGLTHSFDMLLGARLVQGVGSALYMSAATALVVALLPPGKAGRWMSAYQGIFLMGLAIGPLIGGVVAEQFGQRAPFHAYAIMCLIALGLSVTRLPGPAEADRLRAGSGGSAGDTPSVPRRQAVRQLLRHPAFGISLLIILVMFILRSGLRNTAVPLYAEEVLRLPTGTIGLLVTTAAVGQIAAMWHAGKSLDAWGRRPIVILSLFAAAASVILFALAFEPWILFVLMLVLGIVTAYSTSAPTVIMVDVTEPRIRGTAIGIQRMVTDVGQLAGPVLVGLALDYADYTVAFVGTAGLVLLVAFVSLLLRETSPGHPPDRTPSSSSATPSTSTTEPVELASSTMASVIRPDDSRDADHNGPPSWRGKP